MRLPFGWMTKVSWRIFLIVSTCRYYHFMQDNWTIARTWNLENQIHINSKWKLIVFAENYKLEQSYEDHLVVKLVLVSKSIYSLNFFICMTLTNCYKAAFLPPSRDLLYILKQSSKCWVKFISRRNEWHPHKLFTTYMCFSKQNSYLLSL